MSSNIQKSPNASEHESDQLEDHPIAGGDDVACADDDQLVVDMQSELQEKEDLVLALTERLEQAAEQLDRFRRTGAKMGVAGGMPVELIEEQRELFDEMRHMISQWESMQPGATLGRIEIQVTELRDLIAGRLLSGGDLQASTSSLADALAAQQQGATTPQDQQYEPGSWEAQKAALLAGSGSEIETVAPRPPADASVETEAGDEPATVATESDDTPSPINLEEASSEELRQAVVERDGIIESLKEKLKAAEAAAEIPQVDSIEDLPEQWRAKFESLESELKEKLRTIEVELSLERARLAREKAELEQQQEQIQREGGGHSFGSGRDGNAAREGEQSNSGRWLRFLKRGNENADEQTE